MAGIIMPPTIKDQFVREYLDTIWQKFAFNRMLRKVRRIKLSGLWEANLDKLYLETQFKDLINYDDSEDRKALAQERQKSEDKQDVKKIDELQNKIAMGNSVRGNYRKNENFRIETRSYVQMLDLWLNQP